MKENVKVLNNICFLGIGAGGSNVAEVLQLYGFNSAIVNTSPEDSDAVKIINHKLIIGNDGGCGKDRNIAKSNIKNNYKEILKFSKNVFKDDYDMMYLIFTAGGGTGSGAGPILADIYKKMNKKIGLIIILPSLNENIVSQGNSIECLKEVYKLNLPTFIIDNNKYKNKAKSIQEYYGTINEQIAQDFSILLSAERPPSKFGNFDKQDILKILSTVGMCVISTIKFTRETLDGGLNTIEELIIKNLKESIYSPMEFDKILKRAGYIYEVDNSLTGKITYDRIENEIGTPLELFEGYYRSDKDCQKVTTILSGLSFPENRIKSALNIIEKNKNLIMSEKTYEVLDSDLKWFNAKRVETLVKQNITETFKPEDKKIEDNFDLDLTDLFDKYN